MTELQRNTQASLVIVSMTQMDNAMSQLLRLAMPNLSGNMRERLFHNQGPFSSLYSKIEVAFAMGLIDGENRRDLQALRDIRNGFAHSTSIVHFDDPHISDRFKKFSDYNPTVDREAMFLEKCKSCVAHITSRYATAQHVAATITVRARAEASQEKS
jgi:DNA-binding MltR family transcriptional regulator